MAKYIAAAPANGFTASQVTTGQSYPSEVDQLVNDPSESDDPGISEEQAVRTVKDTVDTSDVTKIGEGTGVVYVYGYRCCQDRVKIGSTDVDTVERIAQQINTSTPDKPVLLSRLEQTNAALLNERSKLPWKHGVVRSRAVAPSGLRPGARRFYRSINLLVTRSGATLIVGTQIPCHTGEGRCPWRAWIPACAGKMKPGKAWSKLTNLNYW